MSIFHRISYWVLIFVFNILTILPWLKQEYLIQDLGETLYHVKELGLGLIPYRDFFTHHFVGYLFPFWLIDHFISITPVVIWVVCLSYNFINAILVYAIMLVIADRRSAMAGGFITVTIGWFTYWVGFSFNNQSYFIPFLFVYILFLLLFYKTERLQHLLVSGIVYGILVLFDQRLMLYGIFLPLLFYRRSHLLSLKTILYLIISVFSFPCLFICWLAYHGALSDFVFQTVVYPLKYRNAGTGDTFDYLAFLDFAFLQDIGLLVLLLASLIGLLKTKTHKHIKVLIVGLYLIGFIYAFSGGRNFSHYWLILAPAAILSISFWVYVSQDYNRLLRKCVISLVIVFAFSKTLSPLALYMDTKSPFLAPFKPLRKEIGLFVKENSQEKDKMIVWGYAPQIYLFAERYFPFPDVGLLTIVGANYKSGDFQTQGTIPEMINKFKTFLATKPPEIFVDYWEFRNKDLDSTPSCQPSERLGKNRNYLRIQELSYIKELLDEQYKLVHKASSDTECTEIYFLRKDS